MVQFSKQHPTVSQTPAAAVKTGHDDSGWNWLGSSHGREAGNVCAFAFIKLATKDCSLPRHTRPLIWQNVPFYPGVGANKLMSLLEVTVEFQQLILIAVTLWTLPTPAHTHTHWQLTYNYSLTIDTVSALLAWKLCASVSACPHGLVCASARPNDFAASWSHTKAVCFNAAGSYYTTGGGPTDSAK